MDSEEDGADLVLWSKTFGNEKYVELSSFMS